MQGRYGSSALALVVAISVAGVFAAAWAARGDRRGLHAHRQRGQRPAGWATGQAWGLSLLYSIPNPATGAAHFGDWALELGTLSILGWEPFAGSPVQIYVGFVALAGNLMVAGALPQTASP